MTTDTSAVQMWTPRRHLDGAPCMAPAKGGMWVSVSDYRKLSQQLAEAREALDLITASTSNQHIISIATEALNAPTTGEDSNG